MRFLFGLLPALALAACAAPKSFPNTSIPPRDEPQQTAQWDRIPVGKLGMPLGELALVEGKRSAQLFMHAGEAIEVDKINGKASPSNILIFIDDANLVPHQRCMFYGYETISLGGPPPAYEELAQLKHQPAGSMPQSGWQMDLTFRVIEAIEPAGVCIYDPRVH